MTVKHVQDEDFKITEEDKEFTYQDQLTGKLDQYEGEFDQDHINRIVLWKVNRYSLIPDKELELLNQVDPEAKELDEELTAKILGHLLKTKGIHLAMASTILRFRNPHIYQIIDQRVYRVLYEGKQLKTSYSKSEKKIRENIELYLDYLSDLRTVAKQLNIPFEKADRYLYNADKRLNSSISLNNY